MFGIGTPELLVILAVALIVIGPKKLPDLARSLGRALGEFKRATSDLKQSIEMETGLDEVRNQFKAVQKDMIDSADLTNLKEASSQDTNDNQDKEASAQTPESETDSKPADDQRKPPE